MTKTPADFGSRASCVLVEKRCLTRTPLPKQNSELTIEVPKKK